MTDRLADDWLAVHGRKVLLAETLCDLELYAGTVYRSAGWEGLGETLGSTCANGQYTDLHGKLKQIFVTPFWRDARALLSSEQRCRARWCRPSILTWLRGTLQRWAPCVANWRRCRTSAGGREGSTWVAHVLAVHILAELANMKECLSAAQFARSLSQVQLNAGGERATMHDRLEISNIRGTVIAVDALYTARHRGTDYARLRRRRVSPTHPSGARDIAHASTLRHITGRVRKIP